jgi:succinyl-CoA synthetase beta subunit
MNIHEYQAKQLLKKYKVPTTEGHLAELPEEARTHAHHLGGAMWVVKAQIHAGGRGKGGGVKLAKSLDEVYQHAKSILGMQLVTHQTGPQGKKVHSVWVEKATDIEREFYLGLIVDRKRASVTFMASTEGGMEIEEVAKNHPEKIIMASVEPTTGYMPYYGRILSQGLGLKPEEAKKFETFCARLYECFTQSDCSLMEINPLVRTKSGDFVALDCKINFDDNSLYRHPDIEEMRDPREETEGERAAHEYELSYVALDGNIGCMVNGAGLAMSTMDIIKYHGGEPANFLDVGGGANKEKVTAAFKIILSDPKVRAILVNIFGGIMKCDVIAEGVIAATKELGLKVPLVVRLEGTNVAKGKELLANSGLNIIAANDLTDAAQKVVQAAR